MLTAGSDGGATTTSPVAAYSADSGWESAFVEVLQALVADRPVSPESHFFDDLGANSLTMTHFCARVRKHPDLPPVSIRDIYLHPRIDLLVASLAPADHLPDHPSVPRAAVVAPVREPEPVPVARHAAATVAQGLAFVVFSYLMITVAVRGYGWIAEGSSALDTYLRAVLAGGAALVGTCLLPVAAKWILIGRWTAREDPVWGPAYIRLWIVKSLLHASPIILFVGSPVYVVYLRLLGARIGAGVTILSRTVPVCTDLLTIGEGAVIRKDCTFLGYRAEAGWIQTGSVTIGAGAFVGEKTVLDIDTAIGVAAQLGHSSSLQRGEQVPDGERWHGCPAEPTAIDYMRVPELAPNTLRRFGFALAGVIQALLVYVPLTAGGLHLVSSWLPDLGTSLSGLSGPTAVLAEAVAVSLFAILVLFPLSVAVMFTIPRLLARLVVPERVYPLYGWRFSIHRGIQLLTNRKMLTWLFGDSSYIVPYLRGLGYDLSSVEQTGSNFGMEVQHETPLHVTVGSGTMVADGLSILNAEFSSTSFRVSRVTLGAHSFLGNNIAYPAGARIGENCLLATKVMVPLDGPLREGVGLLGSPAFEIPRTVERDSSFDHLREGEEFVRRLHAKNRYNLRSMGVMLASRWVGLLLAGILGFLMLDSGTGVVHELLLAAYAPVTLAVTAGYYVLLERCITRFRPLEPRLCSIYDPYFWWHERLWKVPDFYLNLFNGTALKPLVWRMLGVDIGRRVLDDGCYLTERTLTTVGDGANLNHLSKLQAHSQEDGTFKSDRIWIGAGATLGVGAFVHYGTSVGAGAVVGTDAFLMKGEEVSASTRWAGNPATAQTAGAAVSASRSHPAPATISARAAS